MAVGAPQAEPHGLVYVYKSGRTAGVKSSQWTQAAVLAPSVNITADAKMGLLVAISRT